MVEENPQVVEQSQFSRFFRYKDGFPANSPAKMIEIDGVKDTALIHFKESKEPERTRCYNLPMCERFVQQGKWEEIKNEGLQTVESP
jgi:hypothetical protein